GPAIGLRWLRAPRAEPSFGQPSANGPGWFRHPALERGAGGGAELGDGGAGGVGKALPHLLVSTLRIRPAAGQQPGRRAGFDAGLFFPAAGEKLPREGRPRARQVPHLPAEIVEKLSGQRVEAGGPSETRRGFGISFH